MPPDNPLDSLKLLMSADNANLDPRVRADWYRSIGQPQQGGPPTKVTQEQWDRMPATERLDYCRRFPQPLDHGRRQR